MLLSIGFATLHSNIKCEHNIQFHFRRLQGENLQVYGLPCGRLSLSLSHFYGYNLGSMASCHHPPKEMLVWEKGELCFL